MSAAAFTIDRKDNREFSVMYDGCGTVRNFAVRGRVGAWLTAAQYAAESGPGFAWIEISEHFMDRASVKVFEINSLDAAGWAKLAAVAAAKTVRA